MITAIIMTITIIIAFLKLLIKRKFEIHIRGISSSRTRLNSLTIRTKSGDDP